MVGPNWPYDGEIDMIEGVSLNNYDTLTLHTSSGCSTTVGPGGQTGSTYAADCGQGGGYTGCSVTSNDATSYGTPFDANGGGVYAMLWTSSSIKIWYFASDNIPSDITSGATPNPTAWPTPTANWAGCNFDEFFIDLQIVFDITFCGSWAGAAWAQSTCSSMNPSCSSYVAEEPQSFGDIFWLVNSIKVYSVY